MGFPKCRTVFQVLPEGKPTCMGFLEAVMVQRNRSIGVTTRLLFGFIGGFFGTLIFHQLTLAVLWGVGLAPFKPFPMAATEPFGVPAVLSLAFWGGVWGIPFALIDRRLSTWPECYRSTRPESFKFVGVFTSDL